MSMLPYVYANMFIFKQVDLCQSDYLFIFKVTIMSFIGD